jgi:hypothetical protein
MDGTSFLAILLAIVAVISLLALLATPESLFHDITNYVGHYRVGVGAEAYVGVGAEAHGVQVKPLPYHPKKPQPLQLHLPPKQQPKGRTLEQILENP